MNGALAQPEKQSLHLSYLLLGAILIALAASFHSAWAWSSESWFRIGLGGGTNVAYSPGPLIPIMVLLMIGSRLRRLPRLTPDVVQRDWFTTIALWPATIAIRAWHLVCHTAITPKAAKAQAYRYRVIVVWLLWAILGAALAIGLHYGRGGPIETVGWRLFVLQKLGVALLFLHIVIFSGVLFYAAWRTFHAQQQSAAVPSGRTNHIAGAVLVVVLLILHVAAVRGQQERLSVMSFLGCLIGLIWYFYGWRVARIFIFPLAFMIFTLPMEWIEDRFGLRAQIFATKHSVNIMKFLGISVEMMGRTSFKIIRHGLDIDFSVAAPCSGLKSLVALTAIAATYAYITQKTTPKMLIIMVCGPFIAIITNIIRLVAVGVTAQFWGRSYAMAVHDHALPMYILAILCLVLIDKGINSKWLRIEDF